MLAVAERSLTSFVRRLGGHVLTLTTGVGRALVQEVSDLRIRLPLQAPAPSISAEAVKAVEQPR